jgi:hypothetical protein
VQYDVYNFLSAKLLGLEREVDEAERGSARLKKVPLFEFEVPCYKKRVNATGTDVDVIKR